jgi:hypothetical protein
MPFAFQQLLFAFRQVEQLLYVSESQLLFVFRSQHIAIVAFQEAFAIASEDLGASQRLVSISKGPHLSFFVQQELEPLYLLTLVL